MTKHNEKPGEFWIQKGTPDIISDSHKEAIDYSGVLREGCPIIHVIEYSAYEKLKQENDKLQSKLKIIEEYCSPYTSYMWAAKITGIIQEIDFRDVAIGEKPNDKAE